jgi:hypothetical protein
MNKEQNTQNEIAEYITTIILLTLILIGLAVGISKSIIYLFG